MARTDEPIKVKKPKAKVKDPKQDRKDAKNKSTAGRDVPLPTTGKFDPADANKDGVVTTKEQNKYNKYLITKAKGKAKVKKITDKSQATPEQKAAKKEAAAKTTAAILSSAAAGLGLAEKAKKIFKK